MTQSGEREAMVKALRGWSTELVTDHSIFEDSTTIRLMREAAALLSATPGDHSVNVNAGDANLLAVLKSDPALWTVISLLCSEKLKTLSAAPSHTDEAGNRFYGWFENEQDKEPSYSPPRDAPCPFCGLSISPEDVRTHNLMYSGEAYAKRSYFYRTHRTCAEKDQTHTAMDGFILDMIARNGD